MWNCPSFSPPPAQTPSWYFYIATHKPLHLLTIIKIRQNVWPLPWRSRPLRSRPRSCRTWSLRWHYARFAILAVPTHQLRRHHHQQRNRAALRKGDYKKDMGRATGSWTGAREWRRRATIDAHSVRLHSGPLDLDEANSNPQQLYRPSQAPLDSSPHLKLLFSSPNSQSLHQPRRHRLLTRKWPSPNPRILPLPDLRDPRHSCQKSSFWQGAESDVICGGQLWRWRDED